MNKNSGELVQLSKLCSHFAGQDYGMIRTKTDILKLTQPF